MNAPATPAASKQADPHPDRADGQARSGFNFARVLTGLRMLIAYGKELLETIQQPESVKQRVLVFHTINLGNIIARITRALERAAALEIRLLKHAEREARSVSVTPVAPRVRTHRPRPDRVRYRSVGEEIAGICRDLCLRPCDRPWRDLTMVIISANGNFTRLVKDMLAWMLTPLSLSELLENPEGFEAHMPPFRPRAVGPP